MSCLAQLLKYVLVVLFNVTMWGCYVNSLKALSSLQATVTNFAANFISSGLAGYFLFEEPLPSKVTFDNSPFSVAGGSSNWHFKLYPYGKEIQCLIMKINSMT